MIRVDGGTFWMGATSEQGYDYDSDERPIHSVTLSGYYIGETEVTRALWNSVVDSYNNSTNIPMTGNSWNEIFHFIKKLNAKTGMKFRLLTEAEWEFAARGGTKTKNYKYAGSNNISNVAWYEDNSGGQVHEVATKAPNELGLYDMSGNVWEWCQDYYGSYSSGSVTDPTGPPSGITTRHVLRGGSWLYDRSGCRVSDRLNATASFQFSDIGFRLGM
jgi:formylglycine-generating enzyme required for sulfatase activity